MKLNDVAEEKRAQVERLRKKLCETAIRRAGIREDVCQGCESPCQFGCQLMDLLGLPRPQEPARMIDVFEAVHHRLGLCSSAGLQNERVRNAPELLGAATSG